MVRSLSLLSGAVPIGGTIDQQEIATRPILRPGDVLEAIPGLVISQHSGEGKANQYYLRGFQLDHGTDLAGTVDGVPVNLPTHAHGQGHSDINWLILELVRFVEYKKGAINFYNVTANPVTCNQVYAPCNAAARSRSTPISRRRPRTSSRIPRIRGSSYRNR